MIIFVLIEYNFSIKMEDIPGYLKLIVSLFLGLSPVMQH